MITKFDSLYAGHIDMDDIGYGGTAVNSRVFPNEHLVTVFAKARNLARLLDRCGYDTFWLAEHHFQREGYECIPNVLLLALDLAHQTEKLKMGCGFNITPMWHPLRLAEDFAAVDVLTGGRVRFGVGRGYHTREVDTFGSPLLDQAANRELFEEQVDIIFKAFNNAAFSHEGKHYTIPARVPYRGYDLKDLTLVPRPVHPVECWQPIQSATPRGLDFMAKYGIKGLIGGGVAEGGAMRGVIEAYRDAFRRAGRETELGEGLCIGFHFQLAETQEQGIKAAAGYFEENLKMFGPLRLVRSLSEEQIDAMADPKRAPYAGLPTIEEAAKRGAYLCGPPAQIIDTLMRLEEEYPGLERVSVSHPMGASESLMLEQLEWFATEVMPAFTPEGAMKIKRVEHIAIAVQSLGQSVDLLKNTFGLSLEYEEQIGQTRLAMLPVGETYLELLEGQGPDSGVTKWIGEKGPGLFHICFEVEDIDGALAELKDKGVKLRDETPRIGHGGARIAFIDPSATGNVLIELAELPRGHGAHA